jgi:hypothetical protein
MIVYTLSGVIIYRLRADTVTRYIADTTFSRVALKNNPMIRDSLLA